MTTKDNTPSVQRYKTLIDLSALVNSSLDIAEIEKRTIEAAAEVTNAEAGSLLFVDETTEELYFDAAVGEKENELRTIRVPKGQGIAGWVAEHHEPVIINDVQNDPRFYSSCDDKSGFITRNMACLPVPANKEAPLLGVLQVINKRDNSFDESDLEILSAFANQVAVAISNARAYQELNKTFLAMVRALADTIVKRDPSTGGHTKRVMNHSVSVGKRLGLGELDMFNLRFAAILHDIGKIGIEDDMLMKQDVLSAGELKVLRIMHTEYGAEILSNIPQMQGVVPGVKYHHERYDGKGCPDQLSGQNIPMDARIIAVADAFDLMTTDKPKSKGISIQSAFRKLEDGAGSQFDPAVVTAFIEAYDNWELLV